MWKLEISCKIVDQDMNKQEQALKSKTFVAVLHFLYCVLC